MYQVHFHAGASLCLVADSLRDDGPFRRHRCARMRLLVPRPAPLLTLYDINGQPISVGARGTPTLLSFFREASCPFCNYRVYELTHNFTRLDALDLDIVVVFSSTEADVRRFIARQPRPFRIVADPDNAAHGVYGIEHSLLGKLRAVVMRLPAMLRGMATVGLAGGRTGAMMPADFLIDARGQVVEAYYGRDAGDHIPMERLEQFAGGRAT